MSNRKSTTEKPQWTPAELQAVRRRLGYNQPDWAAAIGVAVRTVSRWETGGATPLPLAIRAIEELKNRGKRPSASKKAIPDLNPKN